MNNLYLNEIITLTEDEINKSKIALNMSWNGVSHFERWNKSPANDRDVSYAYASHYAGKRNYTRIGQLVLGFVQLPSDNKRWLLVTAGKITSLPESGSCGHKEDERFKGFIGRLIVEIKKGPAHGRYVFNLKKHFSNAKVVELLADEYQDISFVGLDRVHLKFGDLKMILDGEKNKDYKSALTGIKGVYCLTDTKTGKLYIGSAYGEHGIAQRWSDYINTKNGGNDGLIELYNQFGDEYFEKNFEFTLIEYFGMTIDINKVIERERYWKKAFDTIKHGYNRNY